MKLTSEFNRSPSIVASIETQTDYLQRERDRLISLSDAVRRSGSVAPANCWVAEIEKHKGSKTYHYARLFSNSKGLKRWLGRRRSELHRDWLARIARREAIREIEQQVQMLDALIDRQLECAIVFEAEEPDSSHG